MTEYVIRIDPAAMYARTRGYVQHTWRMIRNKPAVTRLAATKTHLKLGAIALALVSMLLIYSASRAITASAPPLKQRFDQTWQDTEKVGRKSDLERVVRKIEITRQQEPPVIVVKTERVVPDPPPQPTMALATAAPLLPIEDDPPPMPRKRQRVANATVAPVARGDICTRHNMRKEITRGGKSWRCRR